MTLSNQAGQRNQTDQREQLHRMTWRCRRGMLELDIILQRFVEHYFVRLSHDELVAFNAMLDLPDNDFWTMVTDVSDNSHSAAENSVLNKLRSQCP